MQKTDEEHIYEKKHKDRQACPIVAIDVERTRYKREWLKKEEIMVDS